jgi:hypothetical protein
MCGVPAHHAQVYPCSLLQQPMVACVVTCCVSHMLTACRGAVDPQPAVGDVGAQAAQRDT